MSLPGRFLDIGGQRVFYHRTGRGRPLVLVHGYLMSHFAWRGIIPELAKDHDVIAIDLPGFGESDRPSPTDFRYDAAGYLETVVGVLDALGLERASIIGHSMGGGIALYTAARQPSRIDKLVVIDSLSYPYPVPVEGRVILAPYVGSFVFKTLYTRSIIRRYFVGQIYGDKSLVTDELVDYVWERLNRPGGFDAAHACLKFVSDPSAVARSLRAIRAPTLIIWGERDRLFSPDNARRLQSDIPGAQVEIIAGSAHVPMDERPAELMQKLGPFLAGVEPARRGGIVDLDRDRDRAVPS